MASAFGHALAAGALGAPLRPSWRVLALGVTCAIIPDADVIAFAFGIPYEHPLGHRGVTHSIAFAVAVGSLVWAVARLWRQRRPNTTSRQRPLALGLYAAAATLSHAALDALTTGGEGVGFLIPFTAERFFFPVRPIAVSPLGVEAFFSEWGLRVLAGEAVWIGLPSIAFIAAVGFWRRGRERRRVVGVGGT
ncbi:MAG: metal-dependent hydrolase [Bacteroidota bacterium]